MIVQYDIVYPLPIFPRCFAFTTFLVTDGGIIVHTFIFLSELKLYAINEIVNKDELITS